MPTDPQPGTDQIQRQEIQEEPAPGCATLAPTPDMHPASPNWPRQLGHSANKVLKQGPLIYLYWGKEWGIDLGGSKRFEEN